MNLSYKPSNKFSLLSFIYLVLACATLILGLAWLYAYAVWYCPLIYINFFITLGFGAVMGLVVHFLVIGLGKVRFPLLAAIIGFVAGIWGWYVHWAIWIDLAYNAEDGEGILVSHVNYTQLLDLVRNPVELFQIAALINEDGLWSIFKITFSGFALWIVWLVEATIILVLPSIAARMKAEKPYNEQKGKWASEIKLPYFEYIQETEANALKSGDLTSLAVLREGDEKTHHAIITLFDMHDGQWYVSVENQYATTDEKGKVKFEARDLLKYAPLDSTLVKALKNPKPGAHEVDLSGKIESTAKSLDN